MELLPSERAVLSLIRALLFEGFQRTHSLAILRGRWPVSHDEAYTGGYIGLLKKGLVATTPKGGSFTITKAGLRAIAEKAA